MMIKGYTPERFPRLALVLAAPALVLVLAGCGKKVDCEKLMDECITKALQDELSIPGVEPTLDTELGATKVLFDMWTTCKSVEGSMENAATINSCLGESDCSKAASCLIENELHYGLLDCEKHVPKQKECAAQFLDAILEQKGAELDDAKKKEFIETQFAEGPLNMKCQQVRSQQEVAEIWMACIEEASCADYVTCYFDAIEKLAKEQGQ
jgi:hypothetical protein